MNRYVPLYNATPRLVAFHSFPTKLWNAPKTSNLPKIK